ncbi:hypothetical protein COLO4_23862 [Corchorus olitorius]|uniref:Uncharacterized protein n=1 Tax=Corchorus olitorius TaxID=93759 RepID=A0A1R3IE99_9ROSI|nr:hypothetical protein COLO4_23862 [Corchorus olitorius]
MAKMPKVSHHERWGKKCRRCYIMSVEGKKWLKCQMCYAISVGAKMT